MSDTTNSEGFPNEVRPRADVLQEAMPKSKTEQLGDDMKAYEVEYEMQIPGDHAFIVRADGHSFSKFTRGFHQPFDENFKTAMIRTTGDAIVQFHASTGYTHSDEITLIFAPMPLLERSVDDAIGDEGKIGDQGKKKQSLSYSDKIQSHPFNGRVCKLLSLISSYISVRFNYHLLSLVESEYSTYSRHAKETPLILDKIRQEQAYTPGFIERIKGMNASFDARILNFPPNKFVDIARHMIWRSLRDCSRNAVSTYARQFFSSKQLHKKNCGEMIEMMKTLKNFDYETQVPENEKIGTYVKKELFETDAINPQTGLSEKVIRSRIVTKTLKANTSKEFVELLLAKYF